MLLVGEHPLPLLCAPFTHKRDRPTQVRAESTAAAAAAPVGGSISGSTAALIRGRGGSIDDSSSIGGRRGKGSVVGSAKLAEVERNPAPPLGEGENRKERREKGKERMELVRNGKKEERMM
mgnify:CR=1 FL=1